MSPAKDSTAPVGGGFEGPQDPDGCLPLYLGEFFYGAFELGTIEVT